MDGNDASHKESVDLTKTRGSTLSPKKVRFSDNGTGWYGDLVSVRVVESYKEHNKLPRNSDYSCNCKVL